MNWPIRSQKRHTSFNRDKPLQQQQQQQHKTHKNCAEVTRLISSVSQLDARARAGDKCVRDRYGSLLQQRQSHAVRQLARIV